MRRQHPIVALPAELLALIFSLGTQDDPMFPVTVSHVCRAWRALALHTPSLWRHVMLDARLDMWAERIRRAKACTLDISLYLRAPPALHVLGQWNHYHQQDAYPRARFIDARDVQMYMFHVIPYISRWRTLDIRFEGYVPFLWNATLSACCVHSFAVHANALKELSLVYPNNDDSKRFTLFDGVAPRLQKLTIYGIRLTWTSAMFRNLSSLDYTHHTFSIGREAASEILLMLQVSSRLETLRLAFPASDGRGDTSSESEETGFIAGRLDVRSSRRVHLAALSVLELTVIGAGSDVPSSLVHLLYHLSLPSLSVLRFSHSPTSPSAHFSRTRPLLAVLSPFPTVTYLRLSQRWSSPRFVRALARTLPLRHLVLSGIISRSLLRALAESLATHSARLGVLELVRCTEIELEGLTELLKTRRGSYVDEVWIRECVVDIDGKSFGVVIATLEARAVRVKVWTGSGSGAVRTR